MAENSATVDLDCCGGASVTNPKKEVFRRNRKPVGLQLYAVKNPIPDEVRDPSEIQKVFTKWKFVPYAGTSSYSGQMLLVWYLMLAKLSPTHNACISKKLKYAIGRKAAFIRSEDPDWHTGEEAQALSTGEAVTYRDAIKTFFEFSGGVVKFHRSLGWSYEATGNAFIEMVFSETLGEGRVFLKAHKVTHCLYVATEAGEMRVIGISPIWEEKYLKKHEPRYVPVYPNFVKDENGNLRTMFHLKNGGEWYGRPESEGADLFKYQEVQNAMYQIKQAGANFTGQLIIEVEDDDPETNGALEDEGAQKVGFNGFQERFEQNYTNKADDPQAVLVTARPYGSRPMFVFQVAPNTNQDWFKVVGEIAEAKIMQAHGCTPRFMGKEVAGGFSQDVFISDYVINMEPVINELREELTRFSNSAISAAWLELLNMPDKNEISITFLPPIQSALDEFRKGQQAKMQPQQPASQQPANQGDQPGNNNNGNQDNNAA